MVQFELNLARIYVLNPKTPEDSFNKSLIWIKEHLEWIEMIYGHIQAQENALFENIIPLEQKLKERKMQKYLRRIKMQTNEIFKKFRSYARKYIRKLKYKLKIFKNLEIFLFI